ncbi:DNA-directed DNA polymerase alpha catalytic subunit pol1 [Tieghemiomyces parasiticus]|uniref:DNA polymerase n=1 Tax=Tieghemiomyces parasiticus TaxID=78921 RepID=A0A9W7ZP38_9FUNG|nr:DNA-directed DNA polymerase alpha catalytic subunit pol1 [Tieghemiomyces parasiticus]
MSSGRKTTSRKDRFAELRKLKASGETRLAHYDDAAEAEDDDDDNLDYEAIERARLEDNFVVDDDGLGYAETGLDGFENDDDNDHSDEDSADEAGRGKHGRRKRRRPEEDDGVRQAGGSKRPSIKAKDGGKMTPLANAKQRLTTFFRKGADEPGSVGRGANRKADTKITSQADDQFMAGLLNDLDDGLDDIPLRKPAKPKVTNAARHAKTQNTPNKSIHRAQATLVVEADLTNHVKQERMEEEHAPLVPPSQPALAFGADAVGIKEEPDPDSIEPLPVPVKQEAPEAPANRFDDDFMDTDGMDPFDDPEMEQEMVEAASALTPHFRSTGPLEAAATPTKPGPRLEDLTSELKLNQDFNLPQFGLNLDAATTDADLDDSKPATGGSTATSSMPSASATATAEAVLDADGTLPFFWLDAFEKDGLVYLFGKVRHQPPCSTGPTDPAKAARYLSCCLTVRNLDRNLFVLPREKVLDATGHETDEDVTMTHVLAEMEPALKALRITRRRAKQVTRKYAFELPGIPSDATYYKLLYPAQLPAYNGPLTGRTFRHIFGTNTSALELFLVKRKMMGPCWLRIRHAQIQHQNLSWCRVEAAVDDPKGISPYGDTDADRPSQPPPLTIMTVNLKTMINPQRTGNEIVAAHLLVNRQVQVDGPADIRTLPSEQYTVVRALTGGFLPVGMATALQKQQMKVELARNEQALLNYLMATLQAIDPDILVGHNFLGHDLNLLLSRMKELKTSHWSRLGRLRRTQWPKALNAGSSGGGWTTASYGERAILSGRVVCDTYLASKDLIRSKSYSLTQLASSELQIERTEIDFDKVPAYFASAKDLATFLKHCQFDAYLVASLMYRLQILPLTKQLTNLAGNLWARTMTGARAERNEFLLLHEFHRCKFICPDKAAFGGKGGAKGAVPATVATPTAPAAATADPQADGDEQELELTAEGLANPTGPPAPGKSARRKPAYTGGLVLEPKRGFYDRFVLLLDFNSLYPSIIQEFNICFTTVNRGDDSAATAPDDTGDQVPDLPDPYLEPGLLPRLLKTLVDRRRQVKNLMKAKDLSPAQAVQFNIRQQALKLTANSMYGCLGFVQSRFYAKPLAMLITHKGREILQSTVQLAEAEHLDVIYGDTDSIMIHTRTTDLDQVMQIGRDFKKKINERYRLLELDIDGIFQRMLLLKKKKYAALTIKEDPNANPVPVKSEPTDPNNPPVLPPGYRTEVEIKGLDLVRRDWCELSHDASQYVLAQILSGDEHDEILARIHAHLGEVSENVRASRVPVAKYVVNKGLTKNPEAYNDAKSQPHVQVALRMRRRGQAVGAGDTVPYVIATLDSHLALTATPKSDNVKQEGEGEAPRTVPTSNLSYAERAYHPKDFEVPDTPLRVDGEWYLNQQVHPPIMRLCEPLEGTDSARLAGCLGLDPAKFSTYGGGPGSGVRGAVGNGRDGSAGPRTLDSQISDAERFAQVDKWAVRCQVCRQTFEFPGIVHLPKPAPAGTIPVPSASLSVQPGFQCPRSECQNLVSFPSLQAQLTVNLRRHIQKYHNFTLVCDDADDVSQHRTRQMSVYGKRCLQPRCRGRMAEEVSLTNANDAPLHVYGVQLLFVCFFWPNRPDTNLFLTLYVQRSARPMLLQYSDRALYTQLLYFENLFRLDKAEALAQDDDQKGLIRGIHNRHAQVYEGLRRAAASYLDLSARRFVDLGDLFKDIAIA